jgi:hypothetical protein
VILHASGAELLPGVDPKGTLGRLIPEFSTRTVRTIGAIQLLSAGREQTKKEMRFTLKPAPGIPPMTQSCRIVAVLTAFETHAFSGDSRRRADQSLGLNEIGF